MQTVEPRRGSSSSDAEPELFEIRIYPNLQKPPLGWDPVSEALLANTTSLTEQSIATTLLVDLLARPRAYALTATRRKRQKEEGEKRRRCRRRRGDPLFLSSKLTNAL